MHRTRNAALLISARSALCCKVLFYLDSLTGLSVMCRLVSSAATGLGSKMVARCSVSVRYRSGSENPEGLSTTAKVGVEGSNPFARSKT
jgi:hypothetical protein